MRQPYEPRMSPMIPMVIGERTAVVRSSAVTRMPALARANSGTTT